MGFHLVTSLGPKKVSFKIDIFKGKKCIILQFSFPVGIGNYMEVYFLHQNLNQNRVINQIFDTINII